MQDHICLLLSKNRIDHFLCLCQKLLLAKKQIHGNNTADQQII